MHYFPLTNALILAFFLAVAALFVVLEVGALEYVYARIGVGRRHMLALLMLSLLGSYVNIPIAELPLGERVEDEIIEFFGMSYVVPAIPSAPHTILAINVGGALVPVGVSLYLLAKHRFFLSAVVEVFVVALVTHALAYPVRGVGIAVPIFVPPIVAAASALVLSRKQAPALAYVGGSLGTLIGADLLNLDKVAGLGAPVASIGGAGTFDGIFMSAVLAVLLA